MSQINYDEMPWLVTAGDATYGPLSKLGAIELQDALRGVGEAAVAWVAQAPDERRLQSPDEAAVLP